MAIESARLVLNETSRTEEALNYVPIANFLGSNGLWGWGEFGLDELETQGPAVPGTVVAYVDPDGNAAVATLYVYVLSLVRTYVVPDTEIESKIYNYQWIPVDMNWPKVDPNTGRYDDINLINTDPDYVNPSLR